MFKELTWKCLRVIYICNIKGILCTPLSHPYFKSLFAHFVKLTTALSPVSPVQEKPDHADISWWIQRGSWSLTRLDVCFCRGGPQTHRTTSRQSSPNGTESHVFIIVYNMAVQTTGICLDSSTAGPAAAVTCREGRDRSDSRSPLLWQTCFLPFS